MTGFCPLVVLLYQCKLCSRKCYYGKEYKTLLYLRKSRKFFQSIASQQRELIVGSDIVTKFTCITTISIHSSVTAFNYKRFQNASFLINR